MAEKREEDLEMLLQVPTKPLIPTISTDDREFRELKEDLRAMGCEGLLAKPWNVQSEDMLREFLFLRGNQWDETTRRDPKNLIHVLRSMGSVGELKKDGQVGKMDYSPECLKGRLIRRRASTRQTAEI